MTKRIYNFNAGPAVLPEPVLKEAQENLFALPGIGMSVLEISHRSKTFDKILADAKQNLKTLLDINDNYEIFCKVVQFTPMANLMPPKQRII
jgi:phosphoserine aminotransferase